MRILYNLSKTNAWKMLGAIFLAGILIRCVWSVDWLFIPSLILLSGIAIYEKNKPVISRMGVLLLGILAYGIINSIFSLYKSNSIGDFFRLFTIVNMLFIVKFVLNKKSGIAFFITAISTMTVFITLFNIIFFYLRFVEATIIGFHDLSQIRYLYVPLGILSNEWVSILLCLLPYPMLGLYIAYRATEYELNFKSVPYYWFKWIFVITIGLVDFNIMITFSRAGMLSLFLLHILLFGILYTDSIEKKRLLLYIQGTFLIVFFLFTVMFSLHVQSGLNESVSHQRSTYGRLVQWRDALDIILLKPGTGIGAGNYALISGKWQNVKADASFTGRVNNSYLQLLIENGIIGFILWSMFFFLLISNLLRRIRCQKDIKSIIIAAGLTSLLFRELFFSSLFYNGGVLLLLLLPVFIFYEDTPRQVVYKLNKSKIIVFLIFISLSFYYYVGYRHERMEYKEAIAKKEMFSKTESAFGNSLLYASLGLQIERSSPFPIDSVIFLHFNLNENNAFPGWRDAIKHYKLACEINPYDDLFFHNLAWLYFGSNKKDSALLYIDHALKLSPNNSMYHISKGLMIEKDSCKAAMKSYKDAIMLSPDICDSPFYRDLSSRYSSLNDQLIHASYSGLKERQGISYNSILEAKCGKLLLAMGQLNEAYDVLADVTKTHPSLSRPWYYLGMIECINGNYPVMKECMRKSHYLNPVDYLPLYGLSKYYCAIGDSISSARYYQRALMINRGKKSVHSERVERIYNLTTYNDDILPQGYLEYLSPVME